MLILYSYFNYVCVVVSYNASPYRYPNDWILRDIDDFATRQYRFFSALFFVVGHPSSGISNSGKGSASLPQRLRE